MANGSQFMDGSERSPSILDRLRQWPALEPAPDDRQPARARWRAAVAQRQRAGAPRRVLMVHGQLLGQTGSGVYTQQIAREALAQGVDLHLLAAGYSPLRSADIPGVADDRISTCLFTPPGETPRIGAVKTPVSGMSLVMPYPVLAYRDRTTDELLDFLRVFGSHIEQLVDRLQPDVIHVNHLWFLSGLARLAAPWIPLVVSAHGTARKLMDDAPRFRDWVVPCVSSADHVCAISTDSVRECIQVFQVPPERITVEGYGFEPDLFYPEPVDRARVLDRVFGIDMAGFDQLAVTVGKFVDWKGLKEFALAIAHLREQGRRVLGLVVGEGDPDSRADLEAFLARRHLSQMVRLPGKVDRAELPDIYRAADVYVLPSHVEPFGMVLMEAMACGAPAVAANVGGPPHFVPSDLIADGLAVLVPPVATDAAGRAMDHDRAAYAVRLADGMARILSRMSSESERQQISESMTHLRWDRLVANLIDISNRISTGSQGHPPCDAGSDR